MRELGVKDSKDLKDPQIIEIAKLLIKTIPYSLLVLKRKIQSDAGKRHEPRKNEGAPS